MAVHITFKVNYHLFIIFVMIYFLLKGYCSHYLWCPVPDNRKEWGCCGKWKPSSFHIQKNFVSRDGRLSALLHHFCRLKCNEWYLFPFVVETNLIYFSNWKYNAISKNKQWRVTGFQHPVKLYLTLSVPRSNRCTIYFLYSKSAWSLVFAMRCMGNFSTYM